MYTCLWLCTDLIRFDSIRSSSLWFAPIGNAYQIMALAFQLTLNSNLLVLNIDILALHIDIRMTDLDILRLRIGILMVNINILTFCINIQNLLWRTTVLFPKRPSDLFGRLHLLIFFVLFTSLCKKMKTVQRCRLCLQTEPKCTDALT